MKRCPRLRTGIIGAATVLVSAQIASAAITIYNGTTTAVTATNGTLGDNVTMGTNGHLVLNGIATDSVNTYTGTFAAGGTPNRGTANIRVNTNAASNTVLNLTTYSFTPNKTDLFIEGNNIGGTGPNSSQVKWTTTPPALVGASGTVTGVNGTILVHDLATDAYNLGTYDSATGIRGLGSSGNDYVTNAFTTGSNVLLTSSQSNGAAASVNSLTLRSSGSAINFSGAGITLPSGAGANGILSTGDTANIISADIRANATDGLTVHAVNDLTISSKLTAGWFVKANAGKLTLSGANDFNSTVSGGSPTINITGGTLSISQDNNLGANANIITLLGGGIEFNSSTVFHHTFRTYTNNSQTSVNVISAGSGVTAELASPITNDSGGGGGITFAGPGKIILSAADTYTGSTVVSGGTVVANNNGAISAATSVSGGAKLQINSGLNLVPSTGSLVVTLSAANSHLEIGSSGNTGSTSITGGITGSSGATLDFDVNGVTLATDMLTASGTVTGGGTWTINLTDLNGTSLLTGTPYTLLQGGAFSGSPTLVGNLTSSNFNLDTTYHGNGLFWDPTSKTLSVQFVTVPEPSIALVFGAAALLASRRRSA